MFIDETDYSKRLDEKGVYRAFIQITIYPKSKDFRVGEYVGGVRDGVVSGSRISNENVVKKYGYLTLLV